VYFNVNFNVFFKLIKVLFLVSGLYIRQNARCNDKNCKFIIDLLKSEYMRNTYTDNVDPNVREIQNFGERLNFRLFLKDWTMRHLKIRSMEHT
jgi:hypothetical protein